jgi:hypothetical protein
MSAAEPDTGIDRDGNHDGRDDVSSGLALAAAIILGLAAILTAWGSYRASLESGSVTRNYAEQQALISQANDIYAQSDQASSLEQQFFLSYVIETSAGNTDGAAYLEETMTDDLRAVVEWWINEPAETSPPTPFSEQNPEFANLTSQLLLADGNAAMDEADLRRVAAEESGKTGDRYGLANVFFAIVLFLAGIATLLSRRFLQVGIVALSVVILVVGVYILVSTPGWASLS